MCINVYKLYGGIKLLIFLLILSIISCIFISYYFMSKLSLMHSQLIAISKQNSSLRNKIKNLSKTEINTEIIFRVPNFKYGTTVGNCDLHTSPFKNSIIINKIQKDTILELQDSAQISDSLWYEISIPSQERVNNKGWITASSISLIQTD